jgi:hypothetical protein
VGQGGVGEGVLLQVLQEQPLQGGGKALQTVFEFGGHVGFAAVLGVGWGGWWNRIGGGGWGGGVGVRVIEEKE